MAVISINEECVIGTGLGYCEECQGHKKPLGCLPVQSGQQSTCWRKSGVCTAITGACDVVEGVKVVKCRWIITRLDCLVYTG